MTSTAYIACDEPELKEGSYEFWVKNVHGENWKAYKMRFAEECKRKRDEEKERVRKLNEDNRIKESYEKRWSEGRCISCGHQLSHPISLAMKVGPVCGNHGYNERLWEEIRKKHEADGV